jgi:hypothetical protein
MTTLIKQFTLIALALTLAGCDKVTVSTLTALLKPAEKIHVASPEASDFQVNGCNLTYKGQSLIFNTSIDEWVKILGPYDRVTHLANDVYFWDEIGLGLFSSTGKHRADELQFEFNETIAFSEDNIRATHGERLRKTKREANESRSKTPFTQTLWVNGAAIKGNWDMSKVNNQLYAFNPKNPHYFGEAYMPTIFGSRFACDKEAPPYFNEGEIGIRVDVNPQNKNEIKVLSLGVTLFSEEYLKDRKATPSFSSRYFKNVVERVVVQ